MQKLFNKIRIPPIAFYICYILVIVVMLLCTGLYGAIDEYLIANVKSNVYSDNSYCIFLGAFLNYVLSAIARLLPDADCFAILQKFFSMLGLIWLGWIIYKADNTPSKLAISYVGIIAVCMLFNLGSCNITITATLFTVIGFASLIYYIDGRISISGLIFGIVYLILGFECRSQAFLLVIPFAVLSGFFNLLKRRKGNFSIDKKRCFAAIAVFAVSFALLTVAQEVYDRSEDGIENAEYNDARSIMVDYPNYDYDAIGDELASIGVSENDYHAVRSMIIIDREVVTADYISEINEIAAYREHNPGALLELVYNLANSLSYLNYLSIALLMMLYVNAAAKNRDLSLELILSVLGCVGISIILIAAGRITGWVIKSIILAGFMPLLLHYPRIKPGESSVVVAFAAFVLLMSIVNSYFAGTLLPTVNPLTSKAAGENEDLAYFCDNRSNYVWNVYDLDKAVLSTYAKAGKLLPQDFIDNNIPDGEWTYGQDYYNEYLDRIGMNNPMKALLYEDNWFYIGSENRCQIIEAWLQEHYDGSAAAIQVGSYNDIPIWSFEASHNT